MKKLFAIALMFVATSAFATERPLAASLTTKKMSEKSLEMNMYRVTNTKEIKVIVKQNEANTLNIKLMDEAGKVLHTEKTNKAGASLVKFDFSDMKDGKYVVEISTEKETIKKEIIITSGKTETVIKLNL